VQRRTLQTLPTGGHVRTQGSLDIAEVGTLLTTARSDGKFKK